jgi:hypothetical protein
MKLISDNSTADMSFLNNLPLGELKTMMDENASTLQRKTAYKIMKRFFENSNAEKEEWCQTDMRMYDIDNL